MEVLELAVAGRPVGWRDVELPGKIGGPPEGLFVEEVSPAADDLADGHARRRDVEGSQHGQLPAIREPRADQGPHDEAAVDGEAALPHRDDLAGIAAVIIPVEGHLVE